MTSGTRLKNTYLNNCTESAGGTYGKAEGEGAYLYGESERSPIVSVLHDLEDVSLEIDLSVKELVVERLHGNLFPSIGVFPEITVLEVDIVRDGFTGQSDFLIDPSSDSGHEGPVGDRDGDDEQNEEEEIEEPSSSEGEDLSD